MKVVKKAKLENDENANPGRATTVENKRKKKNGLQHRKAFKKLNESGMKLYIREAIVGTVESRFYDMTRRQQNHVG